MRRIIAGTLLSFALVAPLALAQDGPTTPTPTDAGYGYNAELARELKTLLWNDANGMTWRHWSSESGVDIFHNRNDGRMRRVHMDYIKGNPSADNMMVAGPGFYIASDIKSSASFGESLMDVRLSEKAGVIDITDNTTRTKINEILKRHGVPHTITSSSSFQNRAFLDILAAHGVNGARYSNSSYGDAYSWTTVWDHVAIESLRRGASNVHVEMWERYNKTLDTRSWGNSDPVSRFNNESHLKKLADYTTEAEIRTFSEGRSLMTADGAAKFGDMLSQAGIDLVRNGNQARVIVENGKVVVHAPVDASPSTLARLYFEAGQIKTLHAQNPAAAEAAFNGRATDAGSTYLRENVRLRALRMTEGLVGSGSAEITQLRSERALAERAASDARGEVSQIEALRSSVKTRRGVDLPPTRAEAALKAFPQAFEIRNFHVDAPVYYESTKAASGRFNSLPWVQKIKQNVGSRRSIFDGINNASEIFVPEGTGGLNSRYEIYDVGPDAKAEMLEKFKARVERLGGTVERVASGDPRLEGQSQGRTFIDGNGKIKVLLPADKPVKAFALIDELTHVRQFSSMLQTASPAEVRALLERAAAGDPAAKEVLTRWEIKAKRNILLTMDPADPNRPLVERTIKELESQRDPYIYARRANGTIDWKRVSREQAGGLAQFALALFLKELAVAIESGDQSVITEFFDGLLTTDFYLNYGLFAAGAQAGQVIYTRAMEKYLTTYIRPRFINSVLKSNVVLAAGMALPQIVMGHFDGRAFAIELTGLGLSSIAVKGGMSAVSFAVDLARVQRGAAIASQLAKASRMAKVGGWAYHAVELAVILYFGEKITTAINAELAEREARENLREAISRFRADVNKPGVTDEQARVAAERLSAAYADYRNFLYDSLRNEEIRLMAELEKVTKQVRTHADGLARYDEMAEREPSRFAALRLGAERLRTQYEAQDKAAIEAVFRDYENRRKRLLDEVYRSPRADDGISSSSDSDAWAFAGSNIGSSGDPFNGRNGLVERIQRWRWNSDFEDRLNRPTSNRLQAYDDEASLLELAARSTSSQAAAAALRNQATKTRQLKDQERALVLGEGPLAGRDQGEAIEIEKDSLGLIRALAKTTEENQTPANGPR